MHSIVFFVWDRSKRRAWATYVEALSDTPIHSYGVVTLDEGPEVVEEAEGGDDYQLCSSFTTSAHPGRLCWKIAKSWLT